MPLNAHGLTHRAVRGIPLFRDDHDMEFYIGDLRAAGAEFGAEFLEYCLMTNHEHFVAIPQTEKTFSKLFARVHKKYATYYNKKYGNKGNVFQTHRQQSVLDERYFFALIRYVLRNPERAGMVETASDYRWSSARFRLGLVDSDPLVSERRPFDLDIEWSTLISSGPDELAIIRKCLPTRCPMGTPAFVRHVLESHGCADKQLERWCAYALKQLAEEDTDAPADCDPI